MAITPTASTDWFSDDQRLPFDILFNIVDDIASDSEQGKDLKTLSTLSQVCRPLTSGCQRQIFETIRLLPHDLDTETLSLYTRMFGKAGFIRFETLESILNTNPTIATYIRNLEYNYHPFDIVDNPRRISRVLNMLTAVRTLTLTSFCRQRLILDWNNIPQHLQESFSRLFGLPTLRRLTIWNGRDFPLDLLSLTRNLRSLNVSGLGFKPLPRPSYHNYVNSSSAVPSTDHLTSGLKLQSLQYLTFSFKKSHAIDDFQRLLTIGGIQSLESLTLMLFKLDLDRPNLHTISSSLMSQNHDVAFQLRHLSIQSILTDFPSSGALFSEILKDVPAWDNLEKLELSLFAFPDVDHLSDLRRLDEHICNGRVFPALRDVALHVDVTDKQSIHLWRNLPQNLTNTAASSKIHLEYTTLPNISDD